MKFYVEIYPCTFYNDFDVIDGRNKSLIYQVKFCKQIDDHKCYCSKLYEKYTINKVYQKYSIKLTKIYTEMIGMNQRTHTNLIVWILKYFSPKTYYFIGQN